MLKLYDSKAMNVGEICDTCVVNKMAGLFGVEPIELVGRNLVFDVRYDEIG